MMPVPETTYSRRYGREDSTYSSYRSTSSSGLGRSSYYSSYASKSSSTLPPRPPPYEYRKYTDSSLGGYSSSSTSRSRLYGASSYRSSVSPVRSSTTSIRRHLETSAPTIAERIKAMEVGESDELGGGIGIGSTAASRLSRYSIRPRDSSLASSSRYSSRDRSGSKEFGPAGTPLISYESPKSSTENLRKQRSSPSASLSRSGSGGALRNGLAPSEVTASDSSSSCSSSASNKGVLTVATTTTTSKSGSVNNDDENKCAKDVENNDSDSVGSSCSASSSISVASSPGINGYASSSNINGNAHERVSNSVVSVNGRTTSLDSKMITSKISHGKSSSAASNGKIISASTTTTTTTTAAPTSSVVELPSTSRDGLGSPEKDTNGNPIVSAKGYSDSIDKSSSGELIVRGTGVTKPLSRGSSGGPAGRDSTAKRYSHGASAADDNANIVNESISSSRLLNGDVVLASEQSVSSTKSSSPPNESRKMSKPKVIYHTIQVEEPRDSKDISPEPISYTVSARKSIDGTGTKLEIKSVTPTPKPAQENVSAEFKVTLPRKQSLVGQNAGGGKIFSNSSATNNGDASSYESSCEPICQATNNIDSLSSHNKSTTITRKDESSRKSSKETSPVVPTSRKQSSSIALGTGSQRTPTPERKKHPSSKSSSSRETTPTPTSTATAIKGSGLKQSSPPPPPPSLLGDSKRGAAEVTLLEANINDSDLMGPHISKYGHPSIYNSQRDSPNKNERERYGVRVISAASDSSDNPIKRRRASFNISCAQEALIEDSDAYTSSSPHHSTGRFRSSPKDSNGYEKAGLTGLRNIGNTCFMNTVLQCLSNTRPLLEYVMKDNYEADINRTTSAMKGSLIRAFGELIHEIWREQRVVDTSSFKDQIQRFAPRFMGYNQQDAQEFLRYLLEGLHEDVNRVASKPTPITTDIDESLSDNEKAIESWKRYLRYESSKIVEMFVGQFKSTLRCTHCGHCSVTFDPFWDLSLPIPTRSSSVRLAQCFELLTKEEVLDGDEKPTCANCKCRRKCTKSLSIQKFPRILVVHLKRFSLAERYRGKLSTQVDFPLNSLDLTPFAANKGQSFSYNLYGVANHSGSTYSGHYIAYCKHPYTGDWHCYNDSRVSPLSPHSVVSSDGYVLFYEQPS